MSLSNRSTSFTLPPISTLLTNEPPRHSSFKLPPLGSKTSSPVSLVSDALISPAPFSQAKQPSPSPYNLVKQPSPPPFSQINQSSSSPYSQMNQPSPYQHSPPQLPPIPIPQTHAQSSLPSPYSRSNSYSPGIQHEHLQSSKPYRNSFELPYASSSFRHDPYTNHTHPSLQHQFVQSPSYIKATEYTNSSSVAPSHLGMPVSHNVRQSYTSPGAPQPFLFQPMLNDFRPPMASAVNDANIGVQAPSESKSTNDSQYAFISHSIKSFPSKEPKIDNIQLARRKRRRTNSKDLEILQREFDLNDNPNKLRRQRIASMVNMNERAVQVWFQNKRQLRKKQRMKAAEQVEMNA